MKIAIREDSEIDINHLLSLIVKYNEENGRGITINSFNNAMDLLDVMKPEFCRTHRSSIVNLDFIKECTQKSLFTLDGTAIPVSRRHYIEVKEKYIKRLFLESEKSKCIEY